MVIKVYVSGSSGNKEVKKRQQRVLLILDSKNVKYEIIDIAEPGSEEAKDFMQNNSTSLGATIGDPNPRHPLPPQIFNEDVYCGDYDMFDMANEVDEMEQFLKLEPNSLKDQITFAEPNLKNGDALINEKIDNVAGLKIEDSETNDEKPKDEENDKEGSIEKEEVKKEGSIEKDEEKREGSVEKKVESKEGSVERKVESKEGSVERKVESKEGSVDKEVENKDIESNEENKSKEGSVEREKSVDKEGQGDVGNEDKDDNSEKENEEVKDAEGNKEESEKESSPEKSE